MSNTLLTPNMITREALRVLHQKLNFIANVNRAYDDSFAVDGAKIGDSLRIRLPNRFTTRTGAALSAQNVAEQQVTLTVANQVGVDTQWTSRELTMSLDDFSKRILDPAMAQLAATIEADTLSMNNSVFNVVPNFGAPLGMRQVLMARKMLNDNLAPMDDQRAAVLNTQDNVDLVDANKGLFQDSAAIRQQYREGMLGRTGGFDFYENTLMPASTTGTAATATGYTVNGAGQTGTGVILASGSTTFAVGDVITFAGCFAVHPETRASTGALQQFVVTAAYAGGAGTIQISPAIVTSGALQTVSASPTNGGAVTKVGGASQVYRPSLFFHKDAFTFATADLVMPKGVDMAARAVQDGISLRMVRQYDINNDRFPVRLDVLYGYQAIRPQLAVRVLSN